MIQIPTRFWLIAILFAIWTNIESLSGLRNPITVITLELFFAAIVFFGIRWADAYENEPVGVMAWAFIAGAGISVQFVVLAYEGLGVFAENIPVAAFIEEIMKALVLIVPFIYKQIDSWTDGLVYGSMVGLGFSVSEDIFYAYGELNEIEIILSRGISSIFAHSVFSGIVGALIVLGIKGVSKIWIPVGLGVGTLAHSIWNFTITEAGYLLTPIFTLFTPAAFIVVAVILRDQEKKILIAKVQIAIDSNAITTEDAHLVVDLRHRKLVRKSISPEKRSLFDKRIARKAKDVFIGF